MKTLIIKIDDDLAKELAKYPNMSQTTREALNVYIGLISTPDSMPKLIQSYKSLINYMKPKFEYYDSVFGQLEKLINMLETRM